MDRSAGRPAAPPFEGEGPHAIWHFSEDPSIEIFRPLRVLVGPSSDLDPLVWAVDTRDAPMFWPGVGRRRANTSGSPRDVAFSSLEFSGSRLRNCAAPMPEVLAQL